jgi:hypothetical protein
MYGVDEFAVGIGSHRGTMVLSEVIAACPSLPVISSSSRGGGGLISRNTNGPTAVRGFSSAYSGVSSAATAAVNALATSASPSAAADLRITSVSGDAPGTACAVPGSARSTRVAARVPPDDGACAGATSGMRAAA